MLLDRALEADLRVAAVEASTHYGRNGHVLAPRLRRALPWLRVVISLREPIRWGPWAHGCNFDAPSCSCRDRLICELGCSLLQTSVRANGVLHGELLRGPTPSCAAPHPRPPSLLLLPSLLQPGNLHAGTQP